MLQHMALPMRRASLITIASVLALLSAVPAFMPALVSAAPAVTERELQSTSAVAEDSTDLQWTFDTPTGASNIERIEIEFCDSPLTGCGNGSADGSDNTTVAADNIPIVPASPTATISGPGGWAAVANSATRAATGRAGAANNQINIDITTGFAGASADEVSIAIPGFFNDEEVNMSYYTRLRIYSTDTPTVPADLKWEGVFAQSTSQTLTVNARVQERLDFCVGETAVNDATTSVSADCSTFTGSSVDIGNIENANTNVSPVLAANGGSNTNAAAMIRTNAVNGASVSYRSLLETSSGALKVPGATCVDTSPFPTGTSTDQCFNSANNTQIEPGQEEFGMTIAGINCGSTTAYSCVFATGTYNLQRDAKYDGNGANTFVTDTDQVNATTNANYAWLDTGLADPIASSTANVGVKVIDDEAMILKFAATAGITTPTGAYSVQADYIATTTF